MIAWIENASAWDRSLPVTLVATGPAAADRHAVSQALVARALHVAPRAIAIDRAEGRPATIVEPMGSGLYLSMAWRGSFGAVALARTPIGVDVETIDPGGEIPWNVLHRAEAALLEELDERARASAFARIWSLKEAYVKALGLGLFREPSSFAVGFIDEERAAVHDQNGGGRVSAAETTWRTLGDASAAISSVILDHCRAD